MPLYTATPGPSRALEGPWAYTVRPDLWPPGTQVVGSNPGQPAWWLARFTWVESNARDELAEATWAGYHLPGAVEALVLAGAFLGVRRPDPTWSWEEVA